MNAATVPPIIVALMSPVGGMVGIGEACAITFVGTGVDVGTKATGGVVGVTITTGVVGVRTTVGRGVGVGIVVGVGVGVGVAVGSGVTVGRGVTVGVALGVEVGVGVSVTIGQSTALLDALSPVPQVFFATTSQVYFFPGWAGKVRDVWVTACLSTILTGAVGIVMSVTVTT